jgi:iron complex transport system substrate-binding protein
MRALRQGRLCRFNADESDTLIRPGPRMAEAARLMADCLRGKQ